MTRSSIFAAAILFLFTGYTNPANAKNYLTCSGTAPGYRVFLDNPVIPLDAANGSVIASGIAEIVYNCPANIDGIGGFKFEIMTFRYTPEGGVYPGVLTGDVERGIGFRILNADTGQLMTDYTGKYTQFAPPTSSKPISGILRLKVEAIKLSDLIYNVTHIAGLQYRIAYLRSVNQGALNPKPGDTGGYHYWDIYPYFRGVITQMPRSCTIANSGVAVRLPSIAAAKLNSVGTTAGDTGFNIGLSCKAGTNVYVTLTDLTDQGNRGNQLTLTPDSTAHGVKLRILNNGQPVGYGPDSAEIGNLNQWYVGPSASTTQIPLSAQYIATGAVSAGTVKGAATFTMSYQ